jgi:hypothetical protein
MEMALETSANARSLQKPPTNGVSLKALHDALASLENSWETRFRHYSVARTLIITEDGIYLGATKLAREVRGNVRPICALVSYHAGVAAARTLIETLTAAEAEYRAGNKAMSAMRLALAFPTPAADEESYRRLHIAAGLLQRGFLSAEELLAIAIIDNRSSVEQSKYSPDQPRVPAGNRDGG